MRTSSRPLAAITCVPQHTQVRHAPCMYCTVLERKYELDCKGNFMECFVSNGAYDMRSVADS